MYGLVLEEVTTRDETSSICVNGARTLPSGVLSMDGPPTTHSDTGIDRVAFLQANLTHDNTRFVNGTPIGERHIFQVSFPPVTLAEFVVLFAVASFHGILSDAYSILGSSFCLSNYRWTKA